MVAPQADPQGAVTAGGARVEVGEAFVDGVGGRERRRPRIGARAVRPGDMHEPLAVLSRELARSRRYGHPVTLVGITLPEGRPAAVAADEIRRSVRTVDTVWTAHTDVFILLPESDRADGFAQLRRLRQAVPAAVGGAVSRLAVFPDDALTVEALLEVARGQMPPALAEPPQSVRGARLRLAAAALTAPDQRSAW